jgi:hypothetical protein
MGIFYERIPMHEAARSTVKKALSENPPDANTLEIKTEEGANEITKNAAGKFSWKRFGLGIGLFIFLFALTLYTGKIAAYADLYAKLVSAIEVLIGGIIGIVLGENASK